MSRLIRFVKGHGHHLIFGVSILSLTLLVAWWSLFIHQSIQYQRTLNFENLKLSLLNHSLRLGNDTGFQPVTGVLDDDPRFELISGQESLSSWSLPLFPGWPHWYLQAREETLQTVEGQYRRKRVMLISEAGFLIFLIFVSSLLLYQYIKLGRRTTQEVKEFWESITHEIKTPITGLKAFLQNLKDQPQNAGELIQSVDLAIQQVERQESLAENMLAGSSYALARRDLRLDRLNLQDFLDLYFKNHALKLGGANVLLGFDRETPVYVRVAQEALRTIMDNISENALKYCQTGFTLTVSLKVEKRRVTIFVEDDGPGIPVAELEAVFSSFKRQKRRRFQPESGAGLGLFISRTLARKMGGDLHAGRAKKGGARFCLQLNRF